MRCRYGIAFAALLCLGARCGEPEPKVYMTHLPPYNCAGELNFQNDAGARIDIPTDACVWLPEKIAREMRSCCDHLCGEKAVDCTEDFTCSGVYDHLGNWIAGPTWLGCTRARLAGN